jgi:hypothetical protein
MSSVTLAGTTFSSETPGLAAWTDPGNAQDSDGSYATSALNAINSTTRQLRATGFDFSSIPADAQISGFEILVEANFSGIATASLSQAGLVDGGASIGTRDSTDYALTASDADYSYGPSLFGAVVNRDDLDADFGLEVAGIRNTGSPTVRIDQVRLRVFFDTPGGAPFIRAARVPPRRKDRRR